MKEKDKTRLWGKINGRGPDECWEWVAGRDKWGYGLFKLNGKRVLAHRLVFALINGEIPDGLLVCHSCDNPSCCNPSHLWLGTHKQNMSDKTSKGRQPKGEEHPASKLTEKDVKEIRKLFAAGTLQIALAKYFGVDKSVIRDIVLFRGWKHIHS